MFNLQGSELVIILLLALVVLGPEKLPDAMRKAGQFYAELKKMSSSFQQEFRSVIDEPVREVRNTANLLRDSADFRKFQDGDREEKPKSAEMVTPSEPDATPSSEVPTFEPRDQAEQVADEATSDTPSGPAPVAPTPIPASPRPFSAGQQSSATPRPRPDADADATSSDPRREAGEPIDPEGTIGEAADEAIADEATASEAIADEATASEAIADEATASEERAE